MVCNPADSVNMLGTAMQMEGLAIETCAGQLWLHCTSSLLALRSQLWVVFGWTLVAALAHWELVPACGRDEPLSGLQLNSLHLQGLPRNPRRRLSRHRLQQLRLQCSR